MKLENSYLDRILCQMGKSDGVGLGSRVTQGDMVGKKSGSPVKKVFTKTMSVHVDAHHCVCVSISVYPHSNLLVKYNY